MLNANPIAPKSTNSAMIRLCEGDSCAAVTKELDRAAMDSNHDSKRTQLANMEIRERASKARLSTWKDENPAERNVTNASKGPPLRASDQITAGVSGAFHVGIVGAA